jgi:hypothetical protein
MNWEYISGFFDADGHITLSAMNKGKNKTDYNQTNIKGRTPLNLL